MTATLKTGDITKEGRLVFWSIDASDHVEPFVLHDDFGVVLFNDGTTEKPVARYILACQNTHDITNTDDFNIFQRALSKIPRGTVVGRYDTCSVPRAYGLPESVMIQFDEAIAKAGLTVETDNRSVCYCPYKN